MNPQLPEKKKSVSHQLLDVHSIFTTIQGEGPFTGHRAVFIRLAGCNLQCPECDTDYTFNRFEISPLGLLGLVAEQAPPGSKTLVVITGGEPFRQNLGLLVRALLIFGYRVQIETNGTLFQPLPYESITIVCSPKTGRLNPKLVPHIAALKYVITAGEVWDDGLPEQALGHPCSPRLARPPVGFPGIIYVQPKDSCDIYLNQRHLDAAIKSVLYYGHVLCLQTHKIINLE